MFYLEVVVTSTIIPTLCSLLAYIEMYGNHNIINSTHEHVQPPLEQCLVKINGAKYFYKLDTNSGFWQIQLASESSKLNRLPFSTTSAPKYLQRKMSRVLTSLEGVVCLIDGINSHIW